MPSNRHEAPQLDSQEQKEQSPSRNQDGKIGAKILSTANYQERHKETVDSSFRKALKNKEKLPGKTSERRNLAYINRLDRLIEKHGDKLEKRIWDRATKKLVIQPEDFTEEYWKTREQILRDEGQGRRLSNEEKEKEISNIQNRQLESLRSWSDFLGNEASPFPIWFKVYAWDGVSKMGVFDKNKEQFSKRDRHTVAPYPKLNPAVLAKVYSTIADSYNKKVENSDIELNELVKSGNFNKLYSKILLQEKTIPKTPEHTEDVRGEWIEYTPKQAEEVANIAEGTPWCISDPSTARSYLKTGQYDQESNQSRFIFFHLENEETNTLADTPCASIRLDSDGKVAEISGLGDGQALEDSLVPIVEEKVKSLPGGEQFLKAFADKKELIRIDHKYQNEEILSKEDLEFIYEINHKITTLDTYNEVDPRITEIKKVYNIEDAIKAGIDVESILPTLNAYSIADNLNVLIKYGANIEQIISELRPKDIIDNLDTLLSHGAKIDINHLLSKLDYAYVYHDDIDTLISHGADIDSVVSILDSSKIASNLDTLISHGADINKIISKLNPEDITKNLNTLINYGGDESQINEKLDN